MTFTYKLSRRLALGHLGLASFLVGAVSACSGGEATSPTPAGPGDLLSAVKIAPSTATIETNQAIRFSGTGIDATGDSMAVSIEWTATGGNITPDGTFSATTAGNFRVIGRGKGHNKSDTSTVVVVPPQPTLTSIAVTPDPASTIEGKTVSFSATGKLSDGSTTAIGVAWSATGGTIDAGGTYSAGMTPGTYRVVATNTANTVADTVPVTVTTPELAQVVLAPASVTLAPGGTQQLTAFGRTTTGDSISTPVSFTATGGTVSAGGLYTAGPTTGTYRLIATSTTTSFADTSLVTIQAASLAQLILVPGVATVAAGGTVQFQVYGRTTAGDSVSAQATYSATGGTIASGGRYTAGGTAGTFRVIGTQVGGTKADTASVTISATDPVVHAGWYVAPSGTSSGNGSSSSPWSLSYALGGAGGQIHAGDTVWVRGGTYNTGTLSVTLSGSTNTRVVVLGYPGEWPIIRGRMDVSGAWVRYQGFEVAGTTAETNDQTGVFVRGRRNQFVNLIVHDHPGNGFYVGAEAAGTAVAGCVAYYNGYNAANNLPGHGFYSQSDSAALTFTGNAALYNWGYGFHSYASQGSLKHISYSGNVAGGNGVPANNIRPSIYFGGGTPVSDGHVVGNLFVVPATSNHTNLYLGDLGGATNQDIEVRNNIVVNGGPAFRSEYINAATVTGNTFVWTINAQGMALVAEATTGVSWGNNHWYGPTGDLYFYWNGAYYNGANWLSRTGFQDVMHTGTPSGPLSIATANPLASGTGVVGIVQFGGASSASADLSSILSPGDTYVIRAAWAPQGSTVASGTYAGGSVSLPLTSLPSLPTPSGAWSPSPVSPGLAVFLVQRT